MHEGLVIFFVISTRYLGEIIVVLFVIYCNVASGVGACESNI